MLFPPNLINNTLTLRKPRVVLDPSATTPKKRAAAVKKKPGKIREYPKRIFLLKVAVFSLCLS